MSGSRTATVTGRGRGRRAPGSSSWRSRSCGAGRTSPAFSSRASGASRCSCRWCRRRTSPALDAQGRPGRRVARVANLEERGLEDLPGPRRTGRRVPQPAARGPRPYLWLDAKVEKVRDGGRVVQEGARRSPTACTSPAAAAGGRVEPAARGAARTSAGCGRDRLVTGDHRRQLCAGEERRVRAWAEPPLDRGRPGVKHHVLVDGHRSPRSPGRRRLRTATMSRSCSPRRCGHLRVRGRIGRPRQRPTRLIADRGYEHDLYRRQLARRGIKPLIARRRTPHGSGLGRRTLDGRAHDQSLAQQTPAIGQN